MAANLFDQFDAQASSNPFDQFDDKENKNQDSAIVRGAKNAWNSVKTGSALVTGDVEGAAQLAAERDAYRRANPGTKEGNQLMQDWESGDGVMGGISNVAGRVAKNWNDAPGVIGGARAVGKDLSAMGGGIVEQIPNMIAPMGGMLAGGAVGAATPIPGGMLLGGFAGAAAGNTLVESGEQVDRALMSAGIDPQNKEAVRAFIAQNGDKILGQAGTKGAIIGAVDTATMGLGGKMLRQPVNAAIDRAIAKGINPLDDLAIQAAVKADPIFQASQKGMQALSRNVGVAALEPAGEFTGEYLGQGVATGDWDTKGAALEALSSLGQSAITFGGQKLYNAATSPLRKGDQATAPDSAAPTVEEMNAGNAALAGASDTYLNSPNDMPQLGYTPSVIVPTNDGGTTQINREDGVLSAAVVDTGIAANMLSTGMPLRAYPDRMSAQSELDSRDDADRMTIVPHPRAQGRFAVVPKNRLTLNALDEATARRQQLEQEDGNAKVDGASGQGTGSVAAGGVGSASGSTGSGTGLGGQPGASGSSLGASSKSQSMDAASAGDAALDELAPPVAQPISTMPGVIARDNARIEQARLEAEARGAQLVDDEAHTADTAPSEAKIAAGNYKKGHVKVGPLNISVENPIGSTRSGKDGKKSWNTTMQAHYGYVKRTVGADGDQVDVFIKEGTANDFNGPVFVVDQFNPKTGRFDEHKALIGYRSQAEAAKAYDDHFSDKSGPKRRHAVVVMPMESFSNWAKNGDTNSPISQVGKQADQAQAEIEQSTGKMSRQRTTRAPGESQKDFEYRRAAEATAARQSNRATIATEATNEADQATLEQNVGGAEIVQGNELPEQSNTKGLSKQAAKSIELLAGTFRKRVVFFTGAEKPDGFWIKGNTVFINVDAGVTPLRVLGHEMLHVMKAESPEAYKNMLGAVQQFLTAKELTAQFKDYFSHDAEMSKWSDEQIADWLDTPANKDMLTEEWMADLSGNRFGEADFWASVFQKVEDQHGAEAAKGIINRLRLAIVRVINNLISAIKGGTQFGVDARMADNLEEIRSALAEGFAQYAIETKRGVAGAKSETAKFARGEANQTLPTRWPTAVGLTPSVNDNMITDLDTLKQDKTQFAKAVKAILEEPGMHSADVVEGSVDQQAEHVIERMKSNLLWLYDQVPEAIRERSKLWYDGARKIADAWSERYDITQSQAAGALAVLSPQKDWFMNVTMAERVLDILHTKMDHKFDQRMDAAAFGFLTKDSIKDDPEAKKNLNAFEAVKDKTLRQVAARHDIRQLSVWIRAYDEAYHDAKHAIVTPEGGFVEDKTTVKGDPTMRAWGDFTTPGKAASIYLNGSAENINKMLGKEHKVRNFYNNIFAPQDPRFTTIDTHAVAADLVRPLAGADKPVSESFGKTGGTNVTGLSGTYALHYEAYRRAAEERGVLPREMQSITWEAVRGLFTEGFKGKKDNLTAIDDIWRKVDSGTLTVDQARKQIVEMAGGIENPDWWNEGNDEYKEVLRDKTYIQQRNPFQGAKVTFEVAPDPRNKEQKAKWDALSEDAKAEISHKVAWKIAAKALASFGDDNMKGELHQQLGGWLADTNPSLSIWFNKRASGNKIAEFARIIGYALNQMAMTRTSPKPFDTGRVDEAGKKIKAQKMGAIQVKLNDGMSAADIHALYTELRSITGKRNKPYISGHSTADGVMVILHDESKSDLNTHDLNQRVGDRLFGRYDVQYDYLYADFPAKGKDSYGLRLQKGQDLGLGAEPSIRARADQLRAESGILLEQLIGEAEKSGKQSLPRSNAASDERSGGRTAGNEEAVPSYGTATTGSVSAQGFHYSSEDRSTLDGRYYGTGAKGRESDRVNSASDKRLKERIYFYVDAGKGITPEQGVGAKAHTVNLNNLYDASAETWIHKQLPRGLVGAEIDNAFESAVIDNGFDGYVADFGTQRAAVLLGRHSVPVTAVGTGKQSGEVSQAKPKADPLAGRNLPAGKMTGAEWKALIPEATMLEDGKSYYKDDVARAMAPKMSPARISPAAQKEIDRMEASVAKTPSAMVSANIDRVKRALAGEIVKDDQGNLIAPNGRKSNLTEEQYRQTRSPEFIKWFGDWLSFHNAKNGDGVWVDGDSQVSKVVDKNGEPQVVYHGTENGGFTTIRPDKADAHRKPMVFAAATRDTARSYSRMGDEIDLSNPEFAGTVARKVGKDWFIVKKDGDPSMAYNVYGEYVDINDAEGYVSKKEAEYFRDTDLEEALRDTGEVQRGVYSLFLNIRNPNEQDFEGANWDGTAPFDKYEVVKAEENVYGPNGEKFMDYSDAEALAEENDAEVVKARDSYFKTDDIANEAIRFGNDGAIIRSVQDDGGRGGYVEADDVFIFFDSKQAKSATQHIGPNYDTEDIRFSLPRVQKIADEFTDRITKELAKPRNRNPVMIHSNTPASMQIIGWKDRRLMVEPSELEKISNKAGFESDKKIGDLVFDLARPGAMFWNEKHGSLNILRRDQMFGSPALIAIRPDVSTDMTESTHLMVTAHKLENQQQLLQKISSGDLKPIYLDSTSAMGSLAKAAIQKKKYRVTLATLAPEDLHARTNVKLDTASSLLSQDDLVKWEDENWGSDPKFSPRRSTPRSATTGQPINASWGSTEVTSFDNVTRQLQDKLIDTKRVVQAIRDAGVAIKEAIDPYMQEILFHGRAAKKTQDFAEQELRPLLNEMQVRKISMQEIEDYLWAKHAIERNAQNRKIGGNPNGSGLTDQEAMDILAGRPVTKNGREIKIDSTRQTAYQAIANRVKAINDKTLDSLVEYGLETQATVDTWKKAYKDYVPLMRDMDDANYSGANNRGLGTGKGFSVRGSASKRAIGSDRGVIDILANVAMQRERAITRGEKNRVSQATYGLAVAAPNPDFWLPIDPKGPTAGLVQKLIDMGLDPLDAQNIAKEPMQSYVDPRTNQVTYRVNPALRGRDDVLAVRINGEDKFLLFSSDERAQNMVRNLKNIDDDQLGGFLQASANVTRWFASVNTQYNPVFGLVNGLRDFSSAMLNLTSTPLRGKQAQVAKYGIVALKGIYQDLRDHRAGRTPSSNWAQEFDEFAKEGGQTGYRDMFQTSKDRTDALTKELQNLSEGKGRRWLKISENNPVFAWLSDYNTSIENAFRLAAYKVAKENGMSPQKAAVLAKNLTVNFNKKGLAATQTGALYAFFNAAVQGTARIGETLLQHNGNPSDHKNIRLSSMGKKIVLGGLVLGVMQAVMGALAGWDDDEPKQFQREKNFIIPIPGSDNYVSIPMPLGFHVIPNIGRIVTEFALGGFKDPGKRMTAMLGVIADAFNPLGSAGLSLQTIAPTFSDPLVALATNKDWNGQSVAKEDFDKNHPTPGWTRSKDTATPWAKGLAYALNYISGGGEYGKGMLSPTPDQIDYLIGQATGGVGREAGKLAQSVTAPMSGDELPLYKVPVVGRFVGETTGIGPESGKFYSNIQEIGAHKDPLKRMREAGKYAEAKEYMADHPEAKMVFMADKAQHDISEMRSLKRKLKDKGADPEKIKSVDDRIKLRMKMFNDQVRSRLDKEAA